MLEDEFIEDLGTKYLCLMRQQDFIVEFFLKPRQSSDKLFECTSIIFLDAIPFRESYVDVRES